MIFSALAHVMFSGLRSLSAQKTRNQGNEVAAQAIEDLQRFGYGGLGVCATAPARPGFGDTALLPNCPAPLPANYGTDPCSGLLGQVQVPKPVYDCQRGSVTYTVHRYVVWTDPGRTAKQLAVFVTWRDQAGVHEVAQQSSVRAPGVANVIGLSAPVLGNAAVNPKTAAIAADGTLQSTLTVEVTASGLSPSDRVIALYTTLDADGASRPTSTSLTTPNGSNWTATIAPTPGLRFAAGSQFFSISALRAADGKATAAVTNGAVSFCGPADPTCSSNALPTFPNEPTVPTTVGIDPAGALKQDVSVSVVTKNVSPTDNVSIAAVTATGLVSVLLQPQTDCTFESCTWHGTILRSAGYTFLPGSRPFYFTAEQTLTSDTGTTISTTAKASKAVEYR